MSNPFLEGTMASDHFEDNYDLWLAHECGMCDYADPCQYCDEIANYLTDEEFGRILPFISKIKRHNIPSWGILQMGSVTYG